MKKFKLNIFRTPPYLITCLLFISQITFAGDFAIESKLEQTKSHIKTVIMKKFNDLEIHYISKTPIESLYQVGTSHGIILSDETAKFIINADDYEIKFYDISGESINDMTSLGVTQYAKQLMNTVSAEETISYKAENERYKVTVFTDINCGYCQHLHSQIAKYNALGITINYLPYAIMGDDSKETMLSVWCSEDKHGNLTDAKLHKKLVSNQCKKINFNKYKEIAKKLGATGTPFIVTENGLTLGGYLAPEDLLQELTDNSSIYF